MGDHDGLHGNVVVAPSSLIRTQMLETLPDRYSLGGSVYHPGESELQLVLHSRRTLDKVIESVADLVWQHVIFRAAVIVGEDSPWCKPGCLPLQAPGEYKLAILPVFPRDSASIAARAAGFVRT